MHEATSSEVVDRFVGAFSREVVPALADGMSSGVAEKMQSEFRPTMQQMNDTLESLKLAVAVRASPPLQTALGIGVIFLSCEALREYFNGLSDYVASADRRTLYQNGRCSQRSGGAVPPLPMLLMLG